MIMRITAVLAVSLGGLSAQERPAPHSLDDQLVRQVLEREHLPIPRSTTGTPIRDTPGPRGLLLWRPGKTLEAMPLPRAARAGRSEEEPPAMTVPPEEEVEEVAAKTPAGKPAAKKPAAKKPAVMKPATPVVRITLLAGEHGATAQLGDQELALRDRDALVRQLREARGNRRPMAVVTVRPDTRLQDLIDATSALRSAGFRDIALGGGIGGQPLTDVEASKVRSLPDNLGFVRHQPARPGVPSLCDGELLLLVDRELPCKHIGPLYQALARQGVWQITFVVQGPGGRRLELPLPIPVDPGVR